MRLTNHSRHGASRSTPTLAARSALLLSELLELVQQGPVWEQDG